ncbi:MAG: hypothetical protein HXK79_08325 [Lachnospiraceae bacterium]|nr:hypothetical protein [Lachnospiraceae bacterium]
MDRITVELTKVQLAEILAALATLRKANETAIDKSNIRLRLYPTEVQNFIDKQALTATNAELTELIAFLNQKILESDKDLFRSNF